MANFPTFSSNGSVVCREGRQAGFGPKIEFLRDILLGHMLMIVDFKEQI
jgi:hypothetical protein